MTPHAHRALRESDVILGYQGYMELIEPMLLEGKETVATGMKGEIDRCQTAISKALAGQDAAMVSSGDAGIYGMAGLILELLGSRGLMDRIEVEVIPGVPALAAAAALLGAPLMHDFAVISLSDLMTPWDVIQTRVAAAAKADFVLVIYNPRSKRRQRHLPQALKQVRQSRGRETPVGIVKDAMRAGQSIEITTLGEMDVSGVDMRSILIIGNSQTRLMNGKMVTPRGYLEKYQPA
jgi:precorrin-3B C17-methyltransferase